MINIKLVNQILSDFFGIELCTSNYFYSFENQSHAHVFDVTAVISKHKVFKMDSWENLYKMVETLKWQK